MPTFEMYLFTRVDKIVVICGVSAFLSMFALVGSLGYFFLMTRIYRDTYEQFERFCAGVLLSVSASAFLICLTGWVAIPTQNELAAIMVVPKILSAENVDNMQKIGANGIDIVKLATDYTKEVLKAKTGETK